MTKFILKTRENWVNLLPFALLRALCTCLIVRGLILLKFYLKDHLPCSSNSETFPRQKCLITPFSSPWGFVGYLPGHWLNCEGNPAISHFWTCPPIPSRRLDFDKEDPCLDLASCLDPVILTTPTVVKVTCIILRGKKSLRMVTDGPNTLTFDPLKTRLTRVY